MEQRPFLSVFSADGSVIPFSSFLDATARSNSFVMSVAANGSPIVYAAMTTEDGVLGTPGALQPSIGGGADALVQAIDLNGIAAVSDPPSITFTPAVVNVAATGPVGGTVVPLICGRLFTCTVDEPDREAITHVTWYDPNGFRAATSRRACRQPAGPGVVPRTYVSLPPGTHTLTLTVRDESGAIGTGTLTVNVASVNTTPGGLQTVVLTDSKFIVNENGQFGAERPVSMTFEQVTAPGLTWLESRWDSAAAAARYAAGGLAALLLRNQVQRRVHGHGPVLRLNIRGMSLAREQAELQLHQLVSGVWTPLTNQDAPSSDEICGEAPGLGTFAILYPPVPETAIAAIAGTVFAENSIDPPGGDPRDEFHDQAPALQSTLTAPERLAVLQSDGQSCSWPTTAIHSRLASECSICRQAGSAPFWSRTSATGSDRSRWTRPVNFSIAPGRIRRLARSISIGSTTKPGCGGVTSAPEVLAMVTDAAGNLFYSDGNIHPVPAAGGDSTASSRSTAVRAV